MGSAGPSREPSWRPAGVESCTGSDFSSRFDMLKVYGGKGVNPKLESVRAQSRYREAPAMEAVWRNVIGGGEKGSRV